MRKPIVVIACLFTLFGSAANAAVAIDNCSTLFHSATGQTSIADTNHTVGAGLTNGALTVIVVAGSNAAPFTVATANWDNLGTPQAMFQLAGSPATNGNQAVYAFGLLNPTAGNKTLSITWNTVSEVMVQTCSWSGVDQTSNAIAFKNFVSSINTNPDSVVSTAGANDAVFAGFSSVANFTSTAAIQLAIDNTASAWAAAFQRASGPNPTMTATPGGTALAAAFTITASAGGGGGTCPKNRKTLGVGC